MKRGDGSVTPHRTRDGRVLHRARITRGSRRVSLGLFSTVEDADAAIRAAAAVTGDVKGHTLRTWGAVWLDRRETDGLHRGAAKNRSAWRVHVETAPFADWPLGKIKRTDVVGWVRALLKREAMHGGESLGRTLSRQTVVNAFNLLHRALGDAADEGHIPINVATGVKVPRVPRSDDPWTFLEIDEVARLLALDLRPDQRAIFTTATYTGLRGGELWGLRWADVHLDGPRPRVVVRFSYRRPTKTGRVREVPLLEPARAALRAWRAGTKAIGNVLVFPAELADGTSGCHAEGFDAGFPAALRRAGIERRVRFYDLDRKSVV